MVKYGEYLLLVGTDGRVEFVVHAIRLQVGDISTDVEDTQGGSASTVTASKFVGTASPLIVTS